MTARKWAAGNPDTLRRQNPVALLGIGHMAPLSASPTMGWEDLTGQDLVMHMSHKVQEALSSLWTSKELTGPKASMYSPKCTVHGAKSLHLQEIKTRVGVMGHRGLWYIGQPRIAGVELIMHIGAQAATGKVNKR